MNTIRLNSYSKHTPLRIAQVAPMWTRVPPLAYGGAELTVHWLTEELVRMGHHVTLFASGDSCTAAELFPAHKDHIIQAMEKGEAYSYEYYAASNFANALEQSDRFDVIHSHMGASMIPFTGLSRVPVIHTVHAGLDSVDEHWVLEKYPKATIAGISKSQISTIPEVRRKSIRVIYHGLDFSEYNFSKEAGSYLAFISRMGPHKNPVSAINIARKLDMPILLAGQPQDETESQFFQDEVRPLIDGKNVVYLGPISHLEKVDLLKGAAALLFPILWEEHFGMVMVEAMACGTPVLAFRRGAAPEVIDYGETGFYGDSEESLVSLFRDVLKLDRKLVHSHAKERFSIERMAAEYVEAYRAVTSKQAA